ncbi:MAG TPA: phytanoyl-CoA dioxygenase family protein, partial [Planctomycetota bacterium]|nr:phytanoyl-CoA dioxygenase family protein [Planctomycetota bacterium]
KAACREVPVLIKAGCVSFHHGLTLHGSERNTSPIPRRAMVSHIMSGNCVYREGQDHHNLHWMKTYREYPKPGERFFGPQYPIMWPIEKNPEARIQKPESL